MKLQEAIEKRRSVRKFKEIPVSRHDIETCVNAARLAPSACNGQPWHFIVLDDKKAKEEFCSKVFTGIYSATKWAAKAPVIVALAGTRGGSMASGLGQMVSGTKFYLIDQGLACQNFCLKAHSLELGACLIGWFNVKAAKKALNLPFGKDVEILIALGHPDESPEPRPRKELKDIISYNKYK